jgi:hypothetical protein
MVTWAGGGGGGYLVEGGKDGFVGQGWSAPLVRACACVRGWAGVARAQGSQAGQKVRWVQWAVQQPRLSLPPLTPGLCFWLPTHPQMRDGAEPGAFQLPEGVLGIGPQPRAREEGRPLDAGAGGQQGRRRRVGGGGGVNLDRLGEVAPKVTRVDQDLFMGGGGGGALRREGWHGKGTCRPGSKYGEKDV